LVPGLPLRVQANPSLAMFLFKTRKRIGSGFALAGTGKSQPRHVLINATKKRFRVSPAPWASDCKNPNLLAQKTSALPRVVWRRNPARTRRIFSSIAHLLSRSPISCRQQPKKSF